MAARSQEPDGRPARIPSTGVLVTVRCRPDPRDPVHGPGKLTRRFRQDAKRYQRHLSGKAFGKPGGRSPASPEGGCGCSAGPALRCTALHHGPSVKVPGPAALQVQKARNPSMTGRGKEDIGMRNRSLQTRGRIRYPAPDCSPRQEHRAQAKPKGSTFSGIAPPAVQIRIACRTSGSRKGRGGRIPKGAGLAEATAIRTAASPSRRLAECPGRGAPLRMERPKTGSAADPRRGKNARRRKSATALAKVVMSDYLIRIQHASTVRTFLNLIPFHFHRDR